VVYRAHLSEWEDEPSQIVAVKTLKRYADLDIFTAIIIGCVIVKKHFFGVLRVLDIFFLLSIQ